MRDVDIVVVGAGAAGLSLARRLVAPPGPGRCAPSVAVLEPPPGALTSPPRTWCFWERGSGHLEEFVSASWGGMCVRDATGRPITGAGPYRYKMIRSADYLPVLTRELSACDHVRLVTATVTGVTGGREGGQVTGVDPRGRTVRMSGRWVFDTRPPRHLPRARTTLFQHFRGWFVETTTDRFDPQVAELMDFRTRQPARGLSFAYVLPFSRRRALVEYTEFSAQPLDTAAYEAALGDYTRRVRSLGTFAVTGAEQGAIPMTDAHFPRHRGPSIFALGTAGGATRPSTGYTFAAVQAQAAAVADACRAGRHPVPPRVHKRRHLLMDAAWLRALDGGRLDGPDFFTRLFTRNPLPRVLRFLDGSSTPAEDLALGLHCPIGPMSRSLAELPLLPRRTAPGTSPVPPLAPSRKHTP